MTRTESVIAMIKKRFGNVIHVESFFTEPDNAGMRVCVLDKSPVHPELFDAIVAAFAVPKVMTPEEKLRQRARASASRHDHE